MPPRSAARTLADLRLILERLEQNKQSYDAEALAALRRILYRRIAELTGDLLSPVSSQDDRPTKCVNSDSYNTPR
jgi:hypothetical protein